MDGDTRASLLLALGILAGLVIMLYGVSLNDGVALNTEMVVGGLVTMAFFGVMVYRTAQLPRPEH